MAYKKKDWADGEVITEAAMDNIENGIAASDTKNTEQDGKITALESKTGAATTAKAGVVKKSAAVPKATGGTVTKAEFDALIDALVAAGIMEAGA